MRGAETVKPIIVGTKEPAMRDDGVLN